MSRGEGCFRPVPKPEWIAVEVLEEGEVLPLCEVRVHLATGETVPADLVLPLPGTRTGCGHIREGWGPEPCGLGGAHRWVLAAIEATQQRGQPGEQLSLVAA